MITSKEVMPTKFEKNRIDALLESFSLSISDQKQLFVREVKICIAYCESLFEAGIYTRLEAEKVKNALATILKRSEFDKNYFDITNAKNIYEFIDQKLINLIGEIGSKLQIGRSIKERNSTVLRLFLSEEIVNISKKLRSIQLNFVQFAEKYNNQVFITIKNGKPDLIMLFPYWCLAKFEVIENDCERLDEVWRRTNVMPLGSNVGIGTSLEFDRLELAKNIGFSKITTNSLLAINEEDYLVESVNSAVIINTHTLHLLDDLKVYKDLNYLVFNETFTEESTNLVSNEFTKVFSNQLEIQNNFIEQKSKQNNEFNRNIEVILEVVNTLNKGLEIINYYTNSMRLDLGKIDEDLSKNLPSESEIFEYLIQRNTDIRLANKFAKKIEKLIRLNSSLEKTKLEELKAITKNVESDIFEELKIDNLINNKNQIGGTSQERVNEALNDAKRILQSEV